MSPWQTIRPSLSAGEVSEVESRDPELVNTVQVSGKAS